MKLGFALRTKTHPLPRLQDALGTQPRLDGVHAPEVPAKNVPVPRVGAVNLHPEALAPSPAHNVVANQLVEAAVDDGPKVAAVFQVVEDAEPRKERGCKVVMVGCRGQGILLDDEEEDGRFRVDAKANHGLGLAAEKVDRGSAYGLESQQCQPCKKNKKMKPIDAEDLPMASCFGTCWQLGGGLKDEVWSPGTARRGRLGATGREEVEAAGTKHQSQLARAWLILQEEGGREVPGRAEQADISVLVHGWTPPTCGASHPPHRRRGAVRRRMQCSCRGLAHVARGRRFQGGQR